VTAQITRLIPRLIPTRALASRRRTLATLTACGALVIGGPVAAAQAAANSAAGSGATVHFSGLPQVGALFSSADYTGSTAAHFCTATVVDSPAGDLVLTAAHCVASFATSTYTSGTLTFAPGYDGGPNNRLGGVWNVAKVDLSPGYQADQNTEDDYALLVIAPKNGLEIQQATGGLRLSTARLPEPVSVVGYNDLAYDVDGNTPIVCSTKAYEETDGGEPWARFDCPNYQDGTSGGPWITRDGAVMGVIGGYEQGGDSPNWSYSAIFNAATLAFYRSVAF
jgi:V8-like Glu-specific endopeptidase